MGGRVQALVSCWQSPLTSPDEFGLTSWSEREREAMRSVKNSFFSAYTSTPFSFYIASSTITITAYSWTDSQLLLVITLCLTPQLFSVTTLYLTPQLLSALTLKLRQVLLVIPLHLTLQLFLHLHFNLKSILFSNHTLSYPATPLSTSTDSQLLSVITL